MRTTTLMTTLGWRWDDELGGAGFRVFDPHRRAIVALIEPCLPGECWEAKLLRPAGFTEANRDMMLESRGFADLEAAHAYCEVHAWEQGGERFPAADGNEKWPHGFAGAPPAAPHQAVEPPPWPPVLPGMTPAVRRAVILDLVGRLGVADEDEEGLSSEVNVATVQALQLLGKLENGEPLPEARPWRMVERVILTSLETCACGECGEVLNDQGACDACWTDDEPADLFPLPQPEG